MNACTYTIGQHSQMMHTTTITLFSLALLLLSAFVVSAKAEENKALVNNSNATTKMNLEQFWSSYSTVGVSIAGCVIAALIITAVVTPITASTTPDEAGEDKMQRQQLRGSGGGGEDDGAASTVASSFTSMRTVNTVDADGIQ